MITMQKTPHFKYNIPGIKFAKSYCGLVDAVFEFIVKQLKESEVIDVRDLSIHERKQKMIIHAIKYLIDNGDFERENIQVVFRGEWYKFYKLN